MNSEQLVSLLRMVRTARLFLPLALLFLSLLGGALVHLLPLSLGHAWFWVCWLLLLCGVALGLVRLYRGLLRPLIAMQSNLYHFNQGEPGAFEGPGGVLEDMSRDIQSMIEELLELYEEMSDRVARQTKRLAQKTASLKILYEVASSINESDDLDDLLIRFLRILKKMVNAKTASVQMRTPEGAMRLVACLDEDEHLYLERELQPIPICRCGRALTVADILCEHNPQACPWRQGRIMYGADAIEAIEVPLACHDELLGFYRLYVPKSGLREREDEIELLRAIGRHLGMAVAKQRSDAEAHRLGIVEERTALAHELHDSLAQTLASLRFQVRMLRETLEQDEASADAKAELERIIGGLDEAHQELRELLNSFRAPVADSGLVQSLERLAQRFREETGVNLMLQSDCQEPQLTGSDEVQVLRIVQEALANIRKHAKAHTVRILVRCRRGDYGLLVEDDGVGFETGARKGRPGEHLGLSILEERAQRLGGELRIESELGEGTRIELNFRPKGRMNQVASIADR